MKFPFFLFYSFAAFYFLGVWGGLLVITGTLAVLLSLSFIVQRKEDREAAAAAAAHAWMVRMAQDQLDREEAAAARIQKEQEELAANRRHLRC